MEGKSKDNSLEEQEALNNPSLIFVDGKRTSKTTIMKTKIWIKVLAIVMAALLLWWLFWAVLIDEDENVMEMPNTEIIE